MCLLACAAWCALQRCIAPESLSGVAVAAGKGCDWSTLPDSICDAARHVWSYGIRHLVVRRAGL